MTSFEDGREQPGIGDTTWIPTTNDYGGWYGRNARPGDVRIAFVAEQVNENLVLPGWPPLYGGRSGLYLWKAIATVSLHPHDMYYTNAIKPPGKLDDLEAELHGEVLPDVVIALGKIASKKLWSSGVSHHAIPHPAFWRRFHWDDTKPGEENHPRRRGGLYHYATFIRDAAVN